LGLIISMIKFDFKKLGSKVLPVAGIAGVLFVLAGTLVLFFKPQKVADSSAAFCDSFSVSDRFDFVAVSEEAKQAGILVSFKDALTNQLVDASLPQSSRVEDSTFIFEVANQLGGILCRITVSAGQITEIANASETTAD
jgi:hypothetical protein